MDIALTIAESNLESNLESSDSDFGLCIGQEEHHFLFEFIKLLVSQHIADINFSDCMIDWHDRQLQPSFMAPLTSRGRELVKLIDNLEDTYVKDKSLADNNGLHAAQETPVSMNFGICEYNRISIVNKIQKIYSKVDT